MSQKIIKTLNETKADFTAKHTHRCGLCNHQVTDPISIQSGCGPKCREKMEIVLKGMASDAVRKKVNIDNYANKYTRTLNQSEMNFLKRAFNLFSKNENLSKKAFKEFHVFKKSCDFVDRFKIDSYLKRSTKKAFEKPKDGLGMMITFYHLCKDLDDVKQGTRQAKNMQDTYGKIAIKPSVSIQNFCSKKIAEQMNKIYAINPEWIMEDSRCFEMFKKYSKEQDFKLNLNSVLLKLTEEVERGVWS